MQPSPQFGLAFLGKDLFAHVKPVEPTEWLTTTLRITKDLGFSTEKSRSERLVTTVLFGLSNQNHHGFSIYSGFNMGVDENLAYGENESFGV